MPDSSFPVYRLKPVMFRMMLPKALTAILLAALLYAGTYLNLKFLRIEITTLMNSAMLMTAALIIGFDLLTEYRKALRLEYEFFTDRVEADGQTMMYNQIVHIDAKRDLFDNVSKTCSLQLNENLMLSHVADDYNIYQYIQNLVNYAHGNNQQQPQQSSQSNYQV